MGPHLALALLLVCSIYLAGRIAERRGRSFKIWAWIAAIIGPLALPRCSWSRPCTARMATVPEAV
ncbi:MAG: hypothetical protein WB036_20855, partial [Pseudolabrys sp.]